MRKVEFKLVVQDAAGLKAGDVLIIRNTAQADQPQPQPGDSVPGDAAAEAKAVLGCFTQQPGGPLVGTVPPRTPLPGGQELHASVRSVKRDALGGVIDVLLRVQFGPQGKPVPLVQSPERLAQQAQASALPEYVLDDDGFQLRRSQLEQLVHSPELRRQLADERLQRLLINIDSSQDREKALDAALQGPALRAFADQVLDLLDAGLPATAPA